MQTKLAYKLFAAFLAMSVMVIVLIVVSYRYVMVTSFRDYIHQQVLDRMNVFSGDLASEYRLHQGWDKLHGNPDKWFDLIYRALPKDGIERGPSPGLKKADPLQMSHSKDFPSQPPLPGTKGREGHSRFVSFRLTRGLSLFDDQQRFVVGNQTAKEINRYSIRPILLDGLTVGWVGLLRRDFVLDPYFFDYIKDRSLTLYSIGGVILLLAACVSLVVSRHLLKPIQQLIQGTRDLTTFRFDTRISIDSKDELGQLASDFNRMADTLSEYETMRQKWITDISHELRTPLAVLKGEIEALQDGVRQIDANTMDSLHAEVLRLSKLVGDLHTLSLADTQSLQAVRIDTLPLEILSRMTTHYQNRMGSNGLTIESDLDLAVSPVVWGDPDQMEQLFANLLENSLRYTDAPGILKIRARSDFRKLTIWFEDSAPGVPNVEMDRIFERLYRVDDSRNRRLGGSGLGLAICRQIVTHHGGSIRADGSPSGGLRIQIDFPLKEADHGPSKEPSCSTPTS
jgi:two-component system sensor histidine kinase BaeS